MTSISLFDWLMLGIGVYVLISGIRGKGRLFATANVKKGMEEKYRKTMRAVYTILGAVMTLNGAVSCLSSYFYSYEMLQEATETTEAAFGWVQKHDLGALSFLTPQVLNTLSLVMLALSMTGIVVMLVCSRKMTEKVARGAAAQQAANPKQAGHVLPVSAFDFDDEPADRKGS